MAKIRYILLILSVFVLGCKSKVRIKQVISGEKCKLWKVNVKNSNKNKSSFYYAFYHGGGFKIFEKLYRTSNIEPFYSSDIVYDRSWELKNDTVLTVSGQDYLIMHLSEDTIVLYNSIRRRLELVKSSEKFQ